MKRKKGSCIVHKSGKTLWNVLYSIFGKDHTSLRQWLWQYNVITLDRQLITIHESNIFDFSFVQDYLLLATVLITKRDTRKKEKKRGEKKNSPLSSKRETFDGFSFDRRNIGSNNPPIHHRWSWQLKNNARVSIVRAEPFIIELPEFQLAGLHISDSIQCYPVKCKIGTDQL